MEMQVGSRQGWMVVDFKCSQYTPKLHIINPHYVTCSLISRNPRERMFVVQNLTPFCHVSLSLISRILSLMQTTKEVSSHPPIAPCVNMWSVTFFFFFFLDVGACIRHIVKL